MISHMPVFNHVFWKVGITVLNSVEIPVLARIFQTLVLIRKFGALHSSISQFVLPLSWFPRVEACGTASQHLECCGRRACHAMLHTRSPKFCSHPRLCSPRQNQSPREWCCRLRRKSEGDKIRSCYVVSCARKFIYTSRLYGSDSVGQTTHVTYRSHEEAMFQLAFR